MPPRLRPHREWATQAMLRQTLMNLDFDRGENKSGAPSGSGCWWGRAEHYGIHGQLPMAEKGSGF